MTSDAHVWVNAAQDHTPSDHADDLIARLRAGDDTAFAELFAQHATAVRRLARGLADDASQAEDIAAETFFRVLQAVRRGSGPKENVRAYLLTVARRVAWEWQAAARDVPVSDDELDIRAGFAEHNAAGAADCTLIARAFATLPERWRSVLWQTEVEGEQPSVVAPQFGLSANAAAALARRARQGLRAAYLQAHLAGTSGAADCRAVLGKLGSYTAGSVTRPEARRIGAHLELCATCRATHDELRDVCFSLRAHAGDLGVLIPLSATAGAGTGGGGFLGAVKATLTGAKLKVAAVVASTAAVGVFGFVAAAALTDLATLGLNGRQGAPELVLERPIPSGDTAPSIDPPARKPVGELDTDARRTPDDERHQPPPEAPPAAEPDRLSAVSPESVAVDRRPSESPQQDEPTTNDPVADQQSSDGSELGRSAPPASPVAPGSETGDVSPDPAASTPADDEPAATPAGPAPGGPSGKTPPGQAEWVLVEESTWCDADGSYRYRRYEYLHPSGKQYVREEWTYSPDGAC